MSTACTEKKMGRLFFGWSIKPVEFVGHGSC